MKICNDHNRYETRGIIVILMLLVGMLDASGQSHAGFSERDVTQQVYFFYLHGGIVQEQGRSAVSDQFGPYRYQDIVDTLRTLGYKVISEVRPKGTVEIEYSVKVAGQVDSLLKIGIRPENIIIAGASQGAYIAIEVAWKVKNPKIRYVIMALCWEYSLEYFSKYKTGFCGNFLSIYERSDRKGSCNELLKNNVCMSGYKEIVLAMGNGHGFIFRPYPEWILPIVEWSKTVKEDK